MIYYNFITIILFFVIFILILKFKDFDIEKFYNTSNIESFQQNNQLNCIDNTKNSLDCNIVRVLKDKRVINHILSLQKKQNNLASKNSINEDNKNIDLFLENTLKNKDNIDKILSKIKKIDSQTTEKLDKYIQEKMKRDKYIDKLTDTVKDEYESRAYISDLDTFNEENKKISNKLAVYYDKIKSLNKKPKLKNENVLILKNVANKNELNLLNVDKKIKIYSEYKEIKSKIYYLIVNDNCVNFIDKFNYTFEPCNLKNNFYFSVNKIDDFNMYNKFISYNKSNSKFDLLLGDENVEYPFYLICPLNNIGLCVTLEDNKLSFLPIKNKDTQRFTKILNSNFCSY